MTPINLILADKCIIRLWEVLVVQLTSSRCLYLLPKEWPLTLLNNSNKDCSRLESGVVIQFSGMFRLIKLSTLRTKLVSMLLDKLNLLNMSALRCTKRELLMSIQECKLTDWVVSNNSRIACDQRAWMDPVGSRDYTSYETCVESFWSAKQMIYIPMS